MKRKYFFLLCFLIGYVGVAYGQAVDSWRSYSSYRTVTAIAQDAKGNIWCATKGGLFEFKGNKVENHYNTIDGMYNVDPTAMAYDSSNHGLWLGYNDGTFEFYNIANNTFTRYEDIYRATRYNPKGITKMLMKDDSLFIATDFGVVLFDTKNDLVLDTYSNLGTFNSGTQVNDMVFNGNKLYCATDQGIATGDESKGDLIEPANWTNYDASNGFVSAAVTAIGYYDGKLYATSGSTNYVYNGTNWSSSTPFNSGAVVSYHLSADTTMLTGVSNSTVTILNGTTSSRFSVSNGQPLLSAYTPTGSNTMYVGTSNDGVAVLNDYTSGKVSAYIVPDGPYLNLFSGLNVDNGVLISGSSSVPGSATSPISATGYYIYKNGQWNNYNIRTSQTLYDNSANSIFISTFNKTAYYFGSWGRGIVEHNISNNKITVYNASNGLEGVSGSNNFVVITGLDKDSKGNIWAISYDAPTTPLYYHQQGSGKWIGIARSPVISPTDVYYGLTIDSYDQKWISLYTAENQGDGLLVLNTGSNPTSQSDDQAYHLTTAFNQGYLPSNTVNAVAEDKQGQMWVGTNSGIVVYPFPDRIINGSANDRMAQYLRKAGTDSVLLSTLDVTAIAVDAANRKWIGSKGDGVWLLSASGDSVIDHFTTSNSPLISNNITSLAVDNQTGMVYIATDQGLVSYVGVVKNPTPKMHKLFIYPNPYSYSKENGPIIIEGLSSQTTVRIITIDGSLVDELHVIGGRAKWNGRDFDGRKVATGVYLVVAVDKNSHHRGVGKVIIVR